MRLINTDNLKPTKGMFIYQTEDADVIATEAYRWELIEREAPTIKAIPIEWLKRYEITKGQEVRLQNAINEWEKENARD